MLILLQILKNVLILSKSVGYNGFRIQNFLAWFQLTSQSDQLIAIN
jgi:hypothetical protein